jgi:hypothetical protein
VLQDNDSVASAASELWTAIAYDPGGTTGWALLCLHPEALNPGYRILDNVVFWTCGQFVGSDVKQGRDMALLAAAWPTAHLVVEDFILRTFRMDRVLLAPVRVTASFEASLAALESAICCSTWAKHRCSNDINLHGCRPRSRALTSDEEKQGLPNGGGYYLQQPSLAMSTLTDERLQAAEQAMSQGAAGLGGAGLGFYSATRGLPHARDAVRHVLTFARREAQARSRGRSLVVPGGRWHGLGEPDALPDVDPE